MEPDLFDETLWKKIDRIEKWIYRLHKELAFLKEIAHLTQKKKESARPIPIQTDMFGT